MSEPCCLKACAYAMLTACVWSVGCAGAVAPPRSPARAAEPGISWRIATGAPGGDADDVCRSDREESCVVRTSTAESPRVAAVSVYLHPGDMPATFSGTVTIEFVDGPVGSRGYEMPLRDYEVDPDEKPPGVASAGLVTAIAGEYQVRIAMLARTGAAPNAYRISLTIPVRVVAPDGT